MKQKEKERKEKTEEGKHKKEAWHVVDHKYVKRFVALRNSATALPAFGAWRRRCGLFH
jgi:hypothetical protein